MEVKHNPETYPTVCDRKLCTKPKGRPKIEIQRKNNKICRPWTRHKAISVARSSVHVSDTSVLI
jgi:hypothetical protein